MNHNVIVNRKMVRANKTIKKLQKLDRKVNRDKKLERLSILKRNIGKVVALSSEELIGTVIESKANPVKDISAKELIAKIESAGLTGMSGNGFPVSNKIEAFQSYSGDTKEKVIIINGAECEPGLLHDAWLLRHKCTSILEGAAYIHKALAPTRMILATRGSMDYQNTLSMDGLETIKVPLKYPMGEEHFLIKQVLGVTLDKKVIPVTRGILVMNVQTVYQIGRILNGSYDGGHYVTLANLQTGEARIAYAHEDSKIEEVLQITFGKGNGNCYAGGGIMSANQTDAYATFTHSISFAALLNEVQINNSNVCKKCGGCTARCPMEIKVKDIVLARQNNPKADISKWNPEQCIHCGTCTYFCGAGKDLSAYIEQ